MQKELNDEESSKDYEKFNQPHKIACIDESINNIYKKIEEKMNFLLDLNRRGFYLKTFEYRIFNFFTKLNKDIQSQYLVFDEEPSLEISLPNTNLYLTLDHNNMLEIDFKNNISNDYRKILINDKKITFNEFGKINKGFQRISHFIMIYVFNIHIYNLGNKMLNNLQNHFKEDFKYIEDPFIENLTPYFYKSFKIKNVQYTISIEENGEVYLMRDPYLYSENDVNLIFVENMRLNKKIGFLHSLDTIQNQNTKDIVYEYGFKNNLIAIAKIIIDFIRNNE